MSRLMIVVAAVVGATMGNVLAQAPPKPPVTDKEGRIASPPANPLGVYATIDMGPIAEVLRRLVTQGQRTTAAREVVRSAPSQMPPALYAAASVLSGDRPEEAIFWYHVGRIRAVYDGLRCRDVTARSFVTLMGQNLLSLELRRSQFYQRDRLVGIARKAIAWDAENPRNYDSRWICLYGRVAHTSEGTDPAEVQRPESEWPELLARVHATHLRSVEEFAATPVPGK